MANFGSYPGSTLKALLENPDLQSPPVFSQADKDKNNGSSSYDAGMAFLGPNLWDKTYTTEDFNLEYMDLDEFLGENGIPAALDNILGADFENAVSAHSSPDVSPSKEGQRSTKAACLSPLTLGPPSLGSPVSSPAEVVISSPPSSPGASRGGFSSMVDFKVSKEDMTLLSLTGEENFDPRNRAFTDEELKPQPMIKKSKKVFVADDAKDDKYWQRRKKNNYAAKRSRDARRIKENQIAMRAAFLEKQNDVMKTELEKLRKENSQLKASLAKYESPQKA